jgi:hypothetical protein
MSIGVRGLHLYPSPWYAGGPPHDQKFQEDLNFIDSIGNLNSVKTVLYSYMEQGGNRGLWLGKQRDKLTAIRQRPSLSGNQTFVFRCWPVQADLDQAGTWYERGRIFGRNLADAFGHIRNTLQIPYAFMEVANEPNHPSEPFGQSMTAYNDFFKGFHQGERDIGYTFPLIYAGLSGDNPNAWYQNAGVQATIRDFAAKIGVHIYWDGVAVGGYSHRNEEFYNSNPEGKYYRWVKRTLAAAGISPRGVVATEFGTPRDHWSGSESQQVNDECLWWRDWQADAWAGWWVEQALLYISNSESDFDIPRYKITSTSLPVIRDC